MLKYVGGIRQARRLLHLYLFPAQHRGTLRATSPKELLPHIAHVAPIFCGNPTKIEIRATIEVILTGVTRCRIDALQKNSKPAELEGDEGQRLKLTAK